MISVIGCFRNTRNSIHPKLMHFMWSNFAEKTYTTITKAQNHYLFERKKQLLHLEFREPHVYEFLKYIIWGWPSMKIYRVSEYVPKKIPHQYKKKANSLQTTSHFLIIANMAFFIAFLTANWRNGGFGLRGRKQPPH